MRILLFVLVIFLIISWGQSVFAVCVVKDNICDTAAGERCDNCGDCMVDPPCINCNPVNPAADSAGCVSIDDPNNTCDPGETCFHINDCPCSGSCDNILAGPPYVTCVPPLIMTSTLDNPVNATSFGDLVDNITNFIFYFVVALAPFLFIIAGFYFTTAAGDVGRITTAKSIAGWTVAGLLTVLIAKGIIEVIKSVLDVA